MSLGNDKARELVNTLKSLTASKIELSQQLSEAISTLFSIRNALDNQLIQAQKDFAIANSGSFNQFIANLPDVG